jgi:cyanate permease
VDVRQPRTPSEHGLDALVVAVAAAILGVLPAFLIGTLALPIRDELGFAETGLGALLTIYSITSAAASAPMGRLVERMGPAGGIRISCLSGAITMLGIAVLTRSWAGLAGWLVLGGLGHAAVHPAANLVLARRITPHRQGLAFGIKQAAIPAAIFLGGLAVPIGTGRVGWRAVFMAAAALSLLVVAWSGRARAPTTAARIRQAGEIRTAPLLVLAVGTALAVGAVQPVAAFYVSYGVERGLSAATAGGLLAAASLLNLTIRVGAGAAVDRRPHTDLLRVVAALVTAGSFGLGLLALAGVGPWTLVIGVLVGVGVGWSWNGLLHFSVVRAHPAAPAAASSITQSGLFTGAAFGPLLFGALVERTSYVLGWSAALISMLVGAALIQLSRRLLTQPHDTAPAGRTPQAGRGRR